VKIILANKFFYLKGGSEFVFFDTAKYLQDKGHEVVFFSMKHPQNLPSLYDRYFVSNVDYSSGGLGSKIKASLNVLYSFEAKKKIEELIKRETPDIAHLHNIYHQISPSILHSLKKFNIPVVLTLHDYKMACASYSMLCNGKICEDCKGGRYYKCLLKGCSADSGIKNLLVTMEMYLHHNMLRIYELVDIFIAPSRFLKDKLEEMGFKRKIVYLPNFIKTEEVVPEFRWSEKSIVYFGRLSREKGLFDLIDAVNNFKGITLKIIGKGPLKEDIRNKIVAENIDNVMLLGYKKEKELKDEIRKSMFVILPSTCFENNPRSVIEAFALGKPVVGSNIGGIPEMVKDGHTGLTFEAGNSRDLRSKIEYLVNNPDRIIEMGKNARLFAESEFNAERHYERLMEIYDQARMAARL